METNQSRRQASLMLSNGIATSNTTPLVRKQSKIPQIAVCMKHYPSLIEKMPPVFTTHQFLRTLKADFPALYTEAVNCFGANPQRVNMAHLYLGHQLHYWSDKVTKIGRKRDRNLGRNRTPCEQWKKVDA